MSIPSSAASLSPLLALLELELSADNLNSIVREAYRLQHAQSAGLNVALALIWLGFQRVERGLDGAPRTVEQFTPVADLLRATASKALRVPSPDANEALAKALHQAVYLGGL